MLLFMLSPWLSLENSIDAASSSLCCSSSLFNALFDYSMAMLGVCDLFFVIGFGAGNLTVYRAPPTLVARRYKPLPSF